MPRKFPKPSWLKRRLPTGPDYEKLRTQLAATNLHTVCQEAKCPNQWECFAKHTATFLIMGNRCTRNCHFCAVKAGSPSPPDPEEPRLVATTAKRMGLKYVVLTSVTRDDLPDGGAEVFAETIHQLQKAISGVKIEVLIPDFQGQSSSLETVLAAKPTVLNHNVETVARLYPIVRPQAKYQRSLQIFTACKRIAPQIMIKSGIMLGLGEMDKEIEQLLGDLFQAGCRIVTMGQYLQPSPRHLPVEKYIHPEKFEYWHKRALAIGFHAAACGPFIRSSYNAAELCGNQMDTVQTSM